MYCMLEGWALVGIGTRSAPPSAFFCFSFRSAVSGSLSEFSAKLCTLRRCSRLGSGECLCDGCSLLVRRALHLHLHHSRSQHLHWSCRCADVVASELSWPPPGLMAPFWTPGPSAKTLNLPSLCMTEQHLNVSILAYAKYLVVYMS